MGLFVAVSMVVAAHWLNRWSADAWPPKPKPKTVHDWVRELRKCNLSIGVSQEEIEAKQKLQEMGTNAIPYLRLLLQSRNSEIAFQFWNFLGRLPLLNVWPEEHLYAGQVRARACEVLQAIGPEAKAAVPDLVALLKDPDMGSSAFTALAKIQSTATNVRTNRGK